MKWFFIAILSVILFSCGCTTVTQNNYNIKDTPEVFYSESATDISLNLKPTIIPITAKYVEVILNTTYMGYFPVKQTIYLPKFKGSKKITLMFNDAAGKKILPKKEITLTN